MINLKYCSALGCPNDATFSELIDIHNVTITYALCDSCMSKMIIAKRTEE